MAESNTVCTWSHFKVMVGVATAFGVGFLTVSVTLFALFTNQQNANFEKVDQRIGEVVDTLVRAEDRSIQADNRLADEIAALRVEIKVPLSP